MERYRHLVESSPDGIVVIENQQITYANVAAVKLFGVTAIDQLLGRPLVGLLDPEDHEAICQQLRSWERGQSDSLDVRIIRPDGRSRDVSVTGASLAYDTERSVQVVIRDITEHKNAERPLRESEERLALAVAGGEEGVWDWDLQTNAVATRRR